MTITATVIAVTQPVVDSVPGADELIAYCARVSNQQNQHSHYTADKLMAYCARHEHWSIFETVNLVLEIQAPRDITRQLLRHRSLHFQEFSQRYAIPDLLAAPIRELRMQHPTNRQASVPMLDPQLQAEWQEDQRDVAEHVWQLADKWLNRGAAKECVRVLYPEGLTMSRLYANGTVRDWWHYCRVRRGHGTQLEHVQLADKIFAAIQDSIPTAWASLRTGEEL